jgi:hypothetical protein
VRPDRSQNQGNGASGPGLAVVAAQLASVHDRPVSASREPRLGVALAGLARELAAARREIAALKRENAALRSKLDTGDAA